ncbi:MFS transporter [Nocardioides sp. ChNu-153]|uniref:MFS transporter n=1 Tax=Nocardioides sp. ChNu-153 TaxID=2779364 RepID=UPI002654F3D7|nr:MFS transporter [Nocardioides sp. ChNu-153]MDN7120404.1 MFS transporter [Nocardioides sp. ChNu-153]
MSTPYGDERDQHHAPGARDPHPSGPSGPSAPGSPGGPGDGAPGEAPGREGPSAAAVAARTARATGHGVARAARATGRAGRFTVTQARRASHAEGAGASGLSRLIELHAFNAAGDAAVAISLAGTLFFQVPTGEARGQVALFLGLTMLPFAIVAPLIGPFLDRFSHGRRWAIGGTMAIRAFLCWVLAGAVVTGSTWLFPAALGVLVASKAYGITRNASVPRLVPPDLTLVKSNARVSLAGVVGAGVSAPLAGLASLAGPEWSLRYAFAVFTVATILAILLPRRVDSTHGETHLALVPGPSAPSMAKDPGDRRKANLRMPVSVSFALRANCGPRWLSGFLTMYVAFLLATNPFDGWSTEVLFALIIGAAGLGNTLGIALASLLRNVNPALTVVLALAAAAAMATLAALFHGVLTLSLLGLTAGLAQSLSKLSLDSTIQTDVHERVRTSALGRSDTLLQLAWVVGGFVGIAVPLEPGRLGLSVAAAVLVAWAVYVLGGRLQARRLAHRAPAGDQPGTAPAAEGTPYPPREGSRHDGLDADGLDADGLDGDGLPPTQPWGVRDAGGPGVSR